MMVIGQDHALAQLAATLAFADAAASASVILLFSDASAATGSTPAGAPLATIELAKPCGAIAGGVLSLSPADPGGALVMQTGVPRAAHWLRGDGALVAAGTVICTLGALTVSLLSMSWARLAAWWRTTSRVDQVAVW